ncbi:MAG: MATE family efflux transporter [Flavobacteriales bacterium]
MASDLNIAAKDQGTSEGIDISAKAILKVAVPIGLGSFVQFFVLFFDNLFIRQLNNDDAFNAANESGLFYIVGVMIGVGLSAGTQILIARRIGEKNISDIGRILTQGVNLAIVSSVVLYSLYFFLVDPLLTKVFVNQDLKNIMVEFLNIRSIGYFFLFPLIVINGFFSGIAQTKMLFYVALITGIGNIILDYLLIFGNFGFPELGVIGAAWASSMAEGMALLYSVLYIINKKFHITYHIKEHFRLFKFTGAKELIVLSYPVAITQVVSLSTWMAFFIMVENVGTDELTVSNIARNMLFLAFISIFGINRTAKTYVSTLTAEGRWKDILPTLKKMMLLSFCGTLILTSVLWIRPDLIMELFNATEHLEMARKVFLVIVPSMLLFSIGGVFFSSVDGFGDTLVTMVIEIIAIIFYMLILYYMVKVNEQPIHIIWIVDLLYFGMLGLLSFIYLKIGKRKVIFQ